MTTKQRVVVICFSVVGLLTISLVISSCGPGQLLGPTFTPMPTLTSTPTSTSTNTPTVTPSPTPTFTPTPTPTATRDPNRHYSKDGFSYIPPAPSADWKVIDWNDPELHIIIGPSEKTIRFVTDEEYTDDIDSLVNMIVVVAKASDSLISSEAFYPYKDIKAFKVVIVGAQQSFDASNFSANDPGGSIGNSKEVKTHTALYVFDGGEKKFMAICSRPHGSDEKTDALFDESMKTFRLEYNPASSPALESTPPPTFTLTPIPPTSTPKPVATPIPASSGKIRTSKGIAKIAAVEHCSAWPPNCDPTVNWQTNPQTGCIAKATSGYEIVALWLVPEASTGGIGDINLSANIYITADDGKQYEIESQGVNLWHGEATQNVWFTVPAGAKNLILYWADNPLIALQ